MRYTILAALLLSTSALADKTYSFETDVQGWTATKAVTSVQISTATQVDGTRALANKFNLPAADTVSIVSSTMDDVSNSTITFNVYLPSTAKLTTLSVFAGNLVVDKTRVNGWNRFTIQTDQFATPGTIGVTLAFNAKFTGTVYIDAVSIVKNPPPPVVDSGVPPTPDAGQPPTPDAGLPPVPDAGSPPPVDAGAIIPADRLTDWNPGLNSVGGIPNRTTICATLAPNGTNDTAAIQDKLNTCPANTVIQLGAGTFRLTGEGLIINRSNLTLRGMGPGVTVLTRTDTSDFANIIIGTRWAADRLKESVNLTVDAAKGSTSVSVAQLPLNPYKAGEIVRIDQLTDTNLSVWSERSPVGDPSRGWFARANRPMPQTMEIVSVSGNTLTFNTKLRANYTVALNAQISRFGDSWTTTTTPAVKFSGIEDMTIELGRGGDGGGNIHFTLAAYSWVKNVIATKNGGASIAFDSSFRCELRDSYIHSTINPNPGGAGYLLALSQGSSDNLIENNVIWNGNKVIVMRSTGGGNVIGYNYMQDAYGAGYPDWVETGINATHMTTAHYELFEGNESFSLGADDTWGNSVYIVAFRNSFTSLRANKVAGINLRDIGHRQAVGLTRGSYYYTVIGNVLGFPGMPLASGQTSFTYEVSQNLTNAVVPMWRLGYNGGSGGQPSDARVKQTLIRGSNFDYVTNTIADGVLALPDSLYLTSKPAFFGTNAWPWVTPDGTTKVKTLPAKERFNALHP